MWRKHTLRVFLTCSKKENSASNHTPRFLKKSTEWRRLSRILTGKWEEIFGPFQTSYIQYWQQCSPIKESNTLSLLRCVLTSWFYKLSLSVLKCQLELVKKVDLFIKINTMYYWLLNLGLTFSVLIIRSLDNQECRKISSHLKKMWKKMGEEFAYQYI